MTGGGYLDDRLLRALTEGAAALPGDLGQLTGYLRLIDGLLGDKASEHEQTWALATASAQEVETLQALEATVAEKAIAQRADTLEAVLLKLEIWRALGAGAEEEPGDGPSLRDRLVLSVEADLARMTRGRAG